VPGVGQQRHGVARDSIGDFHRHEGDVQNDADRKSAAEACWSVAVLMPRMIVTVTIVVAVIVVFAAHRSKSMRDILSLRMERSKAAGRWRTHLRNDEIALSAIFFIILVSMLPASLRPNR
jgi:hypothetical protein